MSSMPTGDIWAVKDDNKMHLNYGENFIFDFTGLARDDLKELLKEFVWHTKRSDNMALTTLKKTVADIKNTFHVFMVQKGIPSLKDITPQDMEEFQIYLKLLRNKRGKPYKNNTLVGYMSSVSSLFQYGQLYHKELVPECNLFVSKRIRHVGQRVMIDYIPDEVMKQINEGIQKEEDIYIKSILVILKHTGMRLGELVSLRTDCIQEHLLNGYTMQWVDYKNRKERNPVPVRIECAIAVQTMMEYTESIRSECEYEDREYLFIRKTDLGVMRVSRGVVSEWIRCFVKRHEIRGTDGEIYPLTSHQFRRTLATDMLSNGVNISIIQAMLGHTTPVTTSRYYADIKDERKQEIFRQIGVIGNIRSIDESIINDAEELAWFKNNAEVAAKMCDGYCTKPVRNGEVCDRLLKRQNCLTCSRFITTPEYLETHRNHLKNLEADMENNKYGEHYASHFTRTIEALREIIERLEAMKDEPGTTRV